MFAALEPLNAGLVSVLAEGRLLQGVAGEGQFYPIKVKDQQRDKGGALSFSPKIQKPSSATLGLLTL